MKPTMKIRIDSNWTLRAALILLTAFISASPAMAQWTTSGTDISNTNTGNVGIGTSTPAAKLSVVSDNPPSNGAIFNDVYSNTNNPIIIMRRARGTLSAPSAVLAGDFLGLFGARGYGSTGFASTNRAVIRFVASENWTDTAQGTLMSFHTNVNGTTTGVERMRITDAGNIGIGTTTPTGLLNVASLSPTATGNYLNFSTTTERIGGNFQAHSLNDSGITTSRGLAGVAYNNAPSATSMGVYGYGRIYSNSASAYGGYFEATNDAGGPVGQSLFGVYSKLSTNASASTYGVYIDNTVGASASSYSLYSNGSAQSYFGGNVGFGTTAPAYKLDVAGAFRLQPSVAPTAANGVIYYDSGLNKFRCYEGGAFKDCISTTSSVAASNVSAGQFGAGDYSFQANLGIGTSTPASKLFVGSGTPAVSTLPGLNVALGGTSYISASDGTVNTFIGADTGSYGIVGTLSNHPLGFRANNSLAMTVMPSGNVGVGSTAPAGKLEVGGTGSALTFFPGNTSALGANAVLNRIVAQSNYGSSSLNASAAEIKFLTGRTTWSTGQIVFSTNNADSTASAPLERMRIDNAGKVGIGTATPSAMLDVSGQVRSSSGGFVFPDGTTQATASFGTVTGVNAGAGLAGGGSGGSVTLNVAAGTGITSGAGGVSVNYGSTAGTAVQGNTTLTVNSGTGMSGGGTATLGSGGTLTLTNSDRGSSQNIFKNVANVAGATQFSAGSNNDSIIFEGTGGTTVSFNAAAKKVTINSSAASSGWTDAGSSVNLTSTTARVGIGTTAPLQKIQVGGNTATATTTPDAISLGATYSSVAGANPKLRLYDDNAGSVYGMGISASQLDFMIPTGARYVWNFSGAEKMRLDESGNLTVSGNVAAKYQDVAEWVPSSQKLLPGTVVVLDSTKTNQVLASDSAYDTKVAGVVSAQPGIQLGEPGEGKVLVATTGRVKVKVDATNAPIHVGDLLVTGEKEGFAIKSEPILIGGRKIHAPGTIIGKALEPLESGAGEILVLLSLQ
jgi:hypothetical protein